MSGPRSPARKPEHRSGHHQRRGRSSERGEPARVDRYGHRAEPGEWSHRVQPLDRDREERPHHERIELRAGQAGDLCAGRVGGERLAVGTWARHQVVRVDNCDDAAPEGDLVGYEPVRVPLSVVAFVMLGDRQRPFAQPVRQWLDQPCSLERVPADELTLGGRQTSRLVQELLVNCELADVVEQRGPPQPVPVGFRKLELVGDQISEYPHPGRVAPRCAIVRTQAGRQHDDLVGRNDRIARHALASHHRDEASDMASARRSSGDLEALRGLTWERKPRL